MSGKRLRIRARLKLSGYNFDWLAGHVVGRSEGFDAGVAHSAKKNAIDKASLLQEIVKLESKLAKAKLTIERHSYVVLDAKRANEVQHKKVISLELQLAAEQQRPSTSQWLHLPPFVLQKEEPWDASAAMDKSKYIASLYGAVTGRTPGRFPSAPSMADGGLIAPEFSRTFIEQIMHGAPVGILQSSQMVRMLSPMRPPGNPTFHWNADWAREEPDAPMQAPENHADVADEDLEEIRAVDLQAISDAFRPALQVSSEVRTPEAEEGIRQASAEGATDMAGGHSHHIDFDIRVDDTELRDVVARVEALGETIRNAALSANQMQSVMERVLHLEIMAGVEAPEESTGEANVNVTGRSGSPGGERT